MRAPRPLTCAALAVAALTATACSSGSGGSGPTATATVTTTVTATATVTATPTASTSPTSTTTTAASARCGTSDLSAKVRALDSGAGQRYGAVVLTNTSSDPCTITGYPGLQLVSATGAKVPTKVVRVTAPSPRTVSLKPGASAASSIGFSVIPSGSEPDSGPCEPVARSVRVIPPNATTSITTAWDLGPVCGKGTISAKAFVAGTGG